MTEDPHRAAVLLSSFWSSAADGQTMTDAAQNLISVYSDCSAAQ
jgi:hypothetical protein